jgi:lipoprotein-anchoring transpeptidase ErfK/SrfK
VSARAIRRGGSGAAAALVLLAAPTTVATALADTRAVAVAAADFRLSRPADHLWRWALVERGVAARRTPDRAAPVVARLRTSTPEDTPEAVPLLVRREVSGRLWVQVRLPVLPNGTTGWVPRDALGLYEHVRTRLVIDRRRLRARLDRRGQTVFRARIGIGQRRWPTPAGEYMVRSRLSDFGNPVYGPIAFGTTARSSTLTDWPGGGFVGVHGTNQPELLPGRVSHGCIRLRNRDIRRLARIMPIGTAVTVR